MERDSIETPLSEKNSKKDKSRWRTQKPREKNELIGDDSARHSRYAEDHTETNQKTACKSDGEYMKPRQRQVVVRCGNRSDIHNARTRAILCPRCCLHGSWICIDDDQSELSRCMVYKIFITTVVVVVNATFESKDLLFGFWVTTRGLCFTLPCMYPYICIYYKDIRFTP